MSSNRRHFLKKSAMVGGGLLLGSDLLREVVAGVSPSIPEGTSKIIIPTDDGLRDARGNVIADRVGGLLDRGMEGLFGSSAEDAWRSLVEPRDIVGLKVNCLSRRRMSTHVELTWAVVERLEHVGIPRNHIIIWDRSDRDLREAGYRLNKRGNDVRCYGTDVVGFHSRLWMYGSVGSMCSRILTDHCTKIINLAVLKDHGICGVTLGMKNFFGAIHNPNKYHGNVGDPYIADLNALPLIRRKTVLTIIDGLTGQYNGGPPYMPQWTWDFNGLLLGIDPVALDVVGWGLIEKKRAEKGMPSLKEAKREPTYIATAADVQHRIGTNDPDRIQVVSI